MYMLSFGGRILDRAGKEEKLVRRTAKGALMENDGFAVFGVAGLLPGREVPSDK
jgi:hypothetical protein